MNTHYRIWLAALAAGLLSLELQAAPAAEPKSPPSSASPAPGAKAGKTEGEIEEIKVEGVSKDTLQVSKLDPPAAFNLEDIQNFPEERLQPVLHNPVNFEEGRDFSSMMDFGEDKMVHPWLPDFPTAPFLAMNGNVDSSARDWTFSVIDQAAGAIYLQQGKGAPPAYVEWNGQDKERGYVAVDTVYTPQITVTNKEGYRRTHAGQPVQFSAIRYSDKSRNVMEVSARSMFQDKKAAFTKEGELLLDKLTDVIREEGKMPIAIRAYDNDSDLARERQQLLAKRLKERLYVSDTQIVVSDVGSPEKRGQAFAFVLNATPGGTE